MNKKTKGYHEADSDYARFLLNLKRTAPIEIKQYQASSDVMDTHLKNKINNIKLVFPYSNNWANTKNIIGYAPLGSFVKHNETKGWTGIKTFFNDNQLGSCAYSYFNLNASGGSIE